ncbi:unnamed protein product [Phytomonas sp. EM1]|nr:unnamed protein product [Phytomonas sp. EM1]|eukprot:CCW65108.1 unnamed protein product [Phytomonas sp. isolate EM1]
MSKLNAGASEWHPRDDIILTSLTLPPTTDDANQEGAALSMPPPGDASTPSPSLGLPDYYPSFMLREQQHPGSADAANGGEEQDWQAEFQHVMELTLKMIEEQLHPSASEERGAGEANRKEPAAAENVDPAVAAEKKAKKFNTTDGRPLPPLTINGNRRWKKPTKAQQRREQAQKNAFEAFAGALLHSVSPFMAPLRERCKTSLPHIKVDQRFGKVGQPQTAIAQFTVAPLVTNYRPRHLHDVTPGDLMEFHYDLALVMRQITSAYSIILGYGPVWKRFAVPYAHIACRDYRNEVLKLCPDETPNSRAEAIYEDDVVKNITDVILAVEELEPLQHMPILTAMSKRLNLAPMYDAFDAIFEPLENYQIEITDLYKTPSTFLLKTSALEVEQKPQPITLYGDPKLWYELPVVSRVVVRDTRDEDSDGAREGDVDGGEGGSSSQGAGRAGKVASATTTMEPAESSGKGHGKRRGDSTVPNKNAMEGSGKGSTQTPPLWMFVAPVVLSLACVTATVGVVLKRRAR